MAAGGLDVAATIDVVEEALRLHAEGDTRLPSKSALLWSDELGSEERDGRIMAMPAYVGGSVGLVGLKWIPSVPSNPSRGLPRGIGLIVLTDPRTGSARGRDGRHDRLGRSNGRRDRCDGAAPGSTGRACCRDPGCGRPGRDAALGPRGRPARARRGARLGHRARASRGVPRAFGRGRPGRERRRGLPRRRCDRRRDDGARTLCAARVARGGEPVLLGLLTRRRDRLRRARRSGRLRPVGARDGAPFATAGAGARGGRCLARGHGRTARSGDRTPSRPNVG